MATGQNQHESPVTPGGCARAGVRNACRAHETASKSQIPIGIDMQTGHTEQATNVTYLWASPCKGHTEQPSLLDAW